VHFESKQSPVPLDSWIVDLWWVIRGHQPVYQANNMLGELLGVIGQQRAVGLLLRFEVIE
jgi:hypothetical protein